MSGPKYTPDGVSAAAGTVTFFLDNVPVLPVEHNMAIGPQPGTVLARSGFVRANKSAVFTVDGLTPGTYTFWCEVADHLERGMVGTLTIEP